MPSKSAKQHRTMQAAAHDAGFAKKMGIPQGVAREFVDADKGKYRVSGPHSERSGHKKGKRSH